MKLISGRIEFIFPLLKQQEATYNLSQPDMALKRDWVFMGDGLLCGLRALAGLPLNRQALMGILKAGLWLMLLPTQLGCLSPCQYIERRKVMMEWWSERIENAALTGERKMTPDYIW